MLRINKLADYGTVVMVHLTRTTLEVSSARDIAAATHLPIATVSKILKRLTASKLLMSTRGAKGGYRLSRGAMDISLADILYAFDETRGLTECSFESDACSLQHVCHVQENWRLISQSIDSALKLVRLDELAKPVVSMATLNQMKQVVRRVNRVQSA